jgi:outer membrane protein TolC
LAEIQTINRIAVLLGQYPQSLRTKLKDGKSIPTPVELGALGLPADLLRQRPDIRRAERELAAQTARVGVATADLYPAFSLTGTFTFQAEDFGDVGRSSSHAYSFGPGLRWHLLSGDRVRSNIQREEALTEQARLRYEQTVLSAVEEVENAMASFIQESKRRTSLQSSADESERSVKLVRELYANGLTDFQNVLDMQRTLWTQQDRFAASRGQVVLNLIRIYKAVGGGWPLDRPEQERLTEKSDESKQR